MALAEFEMTPYLEEARKRVTQQFMLQPSEPVYPDPVISGYDWMIRTYGAEFVEFFSDKLQYLINDKYPSIFEGGV